MRARGLAAQPATGWTSACRSAGWWPSPVSAARASRRSRATCCWPTCSSSTARNAQAGSWRGCTGIEHWQRLDRVLEVDQTPIGKTPRSCPATYIGFWDRRFASCSPRPWRPRHAAMAPGRFSLQHRRGPLPGLRRAGAAHDRDELPARREGRLRPVPRPALQPRDAGGAAGAASSIGDVLKMEVDEAVEFFAVDAVDRAPRCSCCQDVGLGYLTLGQPSPTLSGGEAQRIKLVTELSPRCATTCTRRGQKPPHTLYVLDEPTVGLHMADVEKLIKRAAPAGRRWPQRGRHRA